MQAYAYEFEVEYDDLAREDFSFADAPQIVHYSSHHRKRLSPGDSIAASMPKYVLRLIGDQASPEWYANVNPLVVVLLVVPVTQLVRHLKPATSIGIALALIPLSSLSMASSSLFGHSVSLFGIAVHPITIMMVLGIAIQGLAECFLSPRYLEYASKQAPPGQEGLYLGYAHLNTFFAWGAAFVAGGFLLNTFCPDPNTLSPAVRSQYDAFIAGQGPIPDAYAHANQMWYWIAAVGVVAFVALLIYIWVTNRIDAKTETGAIQCFLPVVINRVGRNELRGTAGAGESDARLSAPEGEIRISRVD